MAFTLNDVFWKVAEKGDIKIYFRWDADNENEPCMTLYPKFAGLAMRPSGVDITLEDAWKFADSYSGQPSRYLISILVSIAQRMGMHPDRSLLHRIADAIVEYIPDLIAMPPKLQTHTDERKLQESIGEATIKIDGQTIFNQEVIVPENIRQ